MTTTSKESRNKIWQQLASTQLCAVTKGHSLEEVQKLCADLPDLKIIGENRWPDCEEKFRTLNKLQRHFIGPLQSNKIRKVLPLIDVIQSVDSLELLKKISTVATELHKTIDFCFQINVSADPLKQGIDPADLQALIEQAKQFKNCQLIGLMTIGEQSAPEQRRQYYRKLKQIFDRYPCLTTLSMGMSDDYQIAIEEGATMVRIGSALF